MRGRVERECGSGEENEDNGCIALSVNGLAVIRFRWSAFSIAQIHIEGDFNDVGTF